MIDVGALVTGLSNLAVARFMLEEGLVWAEGCVFLDEGDCQMVLLRKGWHVVPLARLAALDSSKRFTFYDQVHTTGMDIRQAPGATAALTLGKDMTLRDYAQGAWRMRQIGRGQRLELLVVPEVAKLIASAAAAGEGRGAAGRAAELQQLRDAGEHREADRRRLRDALAWLVVNLSLIHISEPTRPY